MKVINLQAENFKRLKAVDITPDGNTVVIAGKNAQGKTSVLDAIWAAVGGRDGNRHDKPIRDGEDTATVRVDLGDMIVTRTWKGDNSTVKVESADGAQYKSPQTLLDSFIGRLSFDPLAFSMQEPKKQLADLLGVVSLPFDPAALEAERKATFDERTTVGRDGKALAARLAALPNPREGVPNEPVSASALIAKIQEAEAHNRDLDGASRKVTTLEERVALLEEQLAEAVSDRQQAREEVLSLGGHDDVEPLRQALTDIEATNEAVRQAQEWRRVNEQTADARTEYERLTAELTAIEKRKADGLAAANFPIDGLGFDEHGVTFNGVPFSQASAAEKLRVSLAIAIALNPKMRVLRITDGSLLDSDNLALIEKAAADNDFQVWLEMVSEDGEIGVLIEDGQVAQ